MGLPGRHRRRRCLRRPRARARQWRARCSRGTVRRPGPLSWPALPGRTPTSAVVEPSSETSPRNSPGSSPPVWTSIRSLCLTTPSRAASLRARCVPAACRRQIPCRSAMPFGLGRQERERGAVPVPSRRRTVHPGPPRRRPSGRSRSGQSLDEPPPFGFVTAKTWTALPVGVVVTAAILVPVARPGLEAVAPPPPGHRSRPIRRRCLIAGQPSGSVDDRETVDPAAVGIAVGTSTCLTVTSPRPEIHARNTIEATSKQPRRDRRDATDAAGLPDGQRTRIVEVGWIDHGPATIRDMALSRR